MNAKRYMTLIVVVILMTLAVAAVAESEGLSPMEQVGKELYFDETLSAQGDVGCVTCHDPAWGFAGPDSEINAGGSVYPASIPNRWGNRRPPTAAYAGNSPPLYYDEAEEVWVGGMFWDGRATGWELGDPLAEQAKGPFLNPVEHAFPNAQRLCVAVRKADYADAFVNLWPELEKIDCAKNTDEIYDLIGLTIAAFERSAEVNPYTSKYDHHLKSEATLTAEEALGLELFEGKAECAACHISGEGEVFTDFTYDNLGVPKNPENPWYEMPAAYNPDGYDWIDYGLGGFLASTEDYADMAEAEMGKQKVPTLRNVDLRPDETDVKAYMHNGYFNTLYQVVHFYNTRDVKPICANEWVTVEEAMAQNCWPAAEVEATVNKDELGDLGLTAEEEWALVAFMHTLSDGYTP